MHMAPHAQAVEEILGHHLHVTHNDAEEPGRSFQKKQYHGVSISKK